jgi:probable rRNA maturation factor
MKKENIDTDLDEKIVEFICEDLKEDKIKVKEYITNIVYYVCKEEGIDCDKVYISISSATKDEIKNINKEYRNIDRPTDVLSFPIFEKEELQMISSREKSQRIKEIELGDIILCLDVIKEQAKEYGTGILRETLYMITHGVCHLVGYDHIIEDDKIKMRELEEKILSKVGVKKDI